MRNRHAVEQTDREMDGGKEEKKDGPWRRQKEERKRKQREEMREQVVFPRGERKYPTTLFP